MAFGIRILMQGFLANLALVHASAKSSENFHLKTLVHVLESLTLVYVFFIADCLHIHHFGKQEPSFFLQEHHF
jgi:hypothetical protein